MFRYGINQYTFNKHLGFYKFQPWFFRTGSSTVQYINIRDNPFLLFTASTVVQKLNIMNLFDLMGIDFLGTSRFMIHDSFQIFKNNFCDYSLNFFLTKK